MARKSAKLVFPFNGIVEINPYSEQAAETTFDALNVRPYDSILARKRGGQRSGLAKYLPTEVEGTAQVTGLTQSVLAFDSNSVLADTVLSPDPNDTTKTDTFAYANGALVDASSSRWRTFESDADSSNRMFQTEANNSESMRVEGNLLRADGKTGGYRSAFLTTQAAIGSAYVIESTVEFPVVGGSELPQYLVTWRMEADPTSFVSAFSFYMERESGTGNEDMNLVLFRPNVGTIQTSNGFATTNGIATFSAAIKVFVNGDNVSITVNGNTIVDQYVMTALSSNTNIGIVMRVGGSINPFDDDDIPQLLDFTISTAIQPASRRTVKLIAVSSGSIYSGNKADGLVVATNGADVFSITRPTVMEDAFQKVYIADGLLYRILDARTNTLSVWQTALTSGSLPAGGTGTKYDIDTATPATPSFTVSEDLSSILSAGDFIEVLGSTGNDQAYTVASLSGTGPTVITVDQVIQSAIADGTLALGNVAATIMALYRGRIALAGLETDPQNWFMSRSGDPLDWNYFPTTTDGLEAIAGNANQAGKLEDIITALVPYLDDVLYFGGDHTIWALQGDAAENGRIDNVSRQIGIVGPEAWSYDASANLYMMAQNGLYRIQAGSTQLESISQGRLDDTFTKLDFATNRIRLMYDREWRGVHIFVTPITGEPTSSPDHYFWDERTNSFWRDQYPTNIGPTAVHLFDADDLNDRAVLLGGFDGFIRQFDRGAKTDDGTTIHSFVRFTQLVGGDRGQLRVSEITVVLAEGSDSSAVLQVFAGSTSESAVAAVTSGAVKAARTLSEGRNPAFVTRVTNNTIIISIDNNTNDTSWAFETGSMAVEGEGVQRREED